MNFASDEQLASEEQRVQRYARKAWWGLFTGYIPASVGWCISSFRDDTLTYWLCFVLWLTSLVVWNLALRHARHLAQEFRDQIQEDIDEHLAMARSGALGCLNRGGR